MKYSIPIILLIVVFSVAGFVKAVDVPTTQPQPTIALSVGIEEGQKQIRALVSLDGKPVEGAVVVFSIGRTFGNLIAGEDKTLDDGTAAAKFPQGLPGGPTGQLKLVADVKASATYSSAKTELMVDGGVVVTPSSESPPRAFWAAHAPLYLIITIFTLLAGVWGTYVYVISQVISIAKGAKR